MGDVSPRIRAAERAGAGRKLTFLLATPSQVIARKFRLTILSRAGYLAVHRPKTPSGRLKGRKFVAKSSSCSPKKKGASVKLTPFLLPTRSGCRIPGAIPLHAGRALDIEA